MAWTMGEHLKWTIRVSPRRSVVDRKWRAYVKIWRPGRGAALDSATVVPFSRTAADETSVIALGLAAARAYIDASTR